VESVDRFYRFWLYCWFGFGLDFFKGFGLDFGLGERYVINSTRWRTVVQGSDGNRRV
jgi:hypothetical protein